MHYTVVLAKIKLTVSLGDFGGVTRDLIAGQDGVDPLNQLCFLHRTPDGLYS